MIFKGIYRKTFLFSGACSVGKTTFSEYFSRKYKGLLIPEYARPYMENRFNLESELNERDYLAFIAGQLDFLDSIKTNCSNNKLAFIDTDAFSTEVFLTLNLERVDPLYLESLKIINNISKRWTIKNIDEVILLPNDGSRDGHLENSRNIFYNILLSNFRKTSLSINKIKEGSVMTKISQCDKIIGKYL